MKSLLYSKNLDTSSLRWGRVHEADARVAYQQHLQRSDCDLPVSPCGLVVDQETPCLVCSPDGLVGTCGLVEYKCPYKAAQQQLTPVQAATALKDFCSTLNGDALQLKTSHNYYHQIQGCLAITKRSWCDFVVWTPAGISVERINANSIFWNSIKGKLEQFYRLAILPELALPRYTSQQPIREPSTEMEVIT